ncbi:thioredoxin family protein [Brevibacillus ginsengisoli]|uniref:thioredoxin family protein n=1 Tax=Brevibacillus ginsengisoli TaxID=363854 RepID=UPI003CF7BA84
MKQLLADKLGKGITGQQFMDGMSKNQESFVNWYQQFQFEQADDRQFFQSIGEETNWRCLILAAEWCGDVVRNVPVLLGVTEAMNLPTEIMVMEEHLDLMEQFLTMGGRAIPIMIITDQEGNFLGKWGPRPAHVQQVMIRFKQNNPDRDAADYQDNLKVAYQEMINQYGEGTQYQQVIVQELKELFQSIPKA